MRRDPLQILEIIMNALEESQRPLTMNEISQETGIHNVTVRKYVRIIETVRREPSIEIIRTKHSVILRMRD